jgi:hypothetical protein
VLFLTDSVRTDRGPVLNSSCSAFSSSSGVISDLGLLDILADGFQTAKEDEAISDERIKIGEKRFWISFR